MAGKAVVERQTTLVPPPDPAGQTETVGSARPVTRESGTDGKIHL